MNKASGVDNGCERQSLASRFQQLLIEQEADVEDPLLKSESTLTLTEA